MAQTTEERKHTALQMYKGYQKHFLSVSLRLLAPQTTLGHPNAFSQITLPWECAPMNQTFGNILRSQIGGL